MKRDADLISLQYNLRYRCHQAQGRRLHVLVWVTGVLVLAAITGLTVSVVWYLNSDLANPTTAPLALTGVGLSMAMIVTSINRMITVVPRVLTARNSSPVMALAIQGFETGQADVGA